MASDRPSTASIDDLSAALAGRYRVVRELGAGGMATVYLAEDLKHHRPVAVKVLRPELGAAMGGERFVREIEIAARLGRRADASSRGGGARHAVRGDGCLDAPVNAAARTR